MRRNSKCGLVVVVCAMLTAVGAVGVVGVQAQSDTEAMLILNQNATDAGDSQLILLSGPDDATIKALGELETRIVLMPPGPDDMLPVSATAVISINSAGSYVLGGNLFGVSGKHGIEIKKSNVTLDLNGYALIGTPEAKGGIDVPSGVVNVKIQNGAIRGWPQRGIGGKKMNASEISDVRVGNCKWNGIHLGSGIIKNCTSRQNGNNGIHIEHGKSVIESCVVELNGGNGVVCAEGTTIRDVSSSGNAADGFKIGDFNNVQAKQPPAAPPGDGTVLSGCTASNNGNDGFESRARGLSFASCSATGNQRHGFYLLANVSLRGCGAVFNGGIGITVSQGVVIGCTAEENVTGGIQAYLGSQIRNCVIWGHDSDATSYGIQSTGNGVIENNTLSHNSIGINVVDGRSRIAHNHVNCASVDSIGIHVSSFENRIDSNSVEGAGTGIKVTSSGNIIVRNSSSCTTDYDIVGGNQMGTVSTDVTTAGPWDNFDY